MRVAEIFAAKGWLVGAAARRIDCLDSLKARYPGNIRTACIDINTENASQNLTMLINGIGGADIILNSAGIGYRNPDMDPAKDNATICTNCLGFTRIIDTSFNYFASTGRPGHIAAITSVAGTRGLGFSASYSASKRFQSTYLTALDQLRRTKKLPIAITDIQPGFTKTDLLDSSRPYPMLMNPDKVARKIARAIERRRRVATIDSRWNILTKLWRLIPNWLWVRLPIKIAL